MPKLPREEKGYTSNLYIGIDPGLQGGLVVIYSSGNIEATPMPSTEREIWNWFEGFSDQHSPISGTAVIEKVHSMPDQSAQSGFTFGHGYGGLRMALIAAGISFQETTPREWQKALGIVPKKKEETKGEWKNRLLALAQQLHPSLEIWTEKKAKGRQLAIADALLIATYCQRKAEGTL